MTSRIEPMRVDGSRNAGLGGVEAGTPRTGAVSRHSISSSRCTPTKVRHQALTLAPRILAEGLGQRELSRRALVCRGDRINPAITRRGSGAREEVSFRGYVALELSRAAARGAGAWWGRQLDQTGEARLA